MPIYECKYMVLVTKRYAANSPAEAVKWTQSLMSPGDLLLGAVQVDPPLPPPPPEKPRTPKDKPLPPRGRPPSGTPGTPSVPATQVEKVA